MLVGCRWYRFGFVLLLSVACRCERPLRVIMHGSLGRNGRGGRRIMTRSLDGAQSKPSHPSGKTLLERFDSDDRIHELQEAMEVAIEELLEKRPANPLTYVARRLRSYVPGESKREKLEFQPSTSNPVGEMAAQGSVSTISSKTSSKPKVVLLDFIRAHTAEFGSVELPLQPSQLENALECMPESLSNWARRVCSADASTTIPLELSGIDGELLGSLALTAFLAVVRPGVDWVEALQWTYMGLVEEVTGELPSSEHGQEVLDAGLVWRCARFIWTAAVAAALSIIHSQVYWNTAVLMEKFRSVNSVPDDLEEYESWPNWAAYVVMMDEGDRETLAFQTPRELNSVLRSFQIDINDSGENSTENVDEEPIAPGSPLEISEAASPSKPQENAADETDSEESGGESGSEDAETGEVKDGESEEEEDEEDEEDSSEDEEESEGEEEEVEGEHQSTVSGAAEDEESDQDADDLELSNAQDADSEEEADGDSDEAHSTAHVEASSEQRGESNADDHAAHDDENESVTAQSSPEDAQSTPDDAEQAAEQDELERASAPGSTGADEDMLVDGNEDVQSPSSPAANSAEADSTDKRAEVEPEADVEDPADADVDGSTDADVNAHSAPVEHSGEGEDESADPHPEAAGIGEPSVAEANDGVDDSATGAEEENGTVGEQPEEES